MKNKIELVSCLRNGSECREHRYFINSRFNDSYTYFQNKEYSRSILALKNAYLKTTELQTSSCVKCANLFRGAIIQSLEGIHYDLHKMTSGFFGTRRFRSSYELASDVLNEFKGSNE